MSRLTLVCVCLCLLSLSSCCTPKAIGALPVQLRSQETSNWCWAASGQMIMTYLGNGQTQCTQANTRFGRNDCCAIALCPNPLAPTFDAAGNCIGCPCPGWPEFDKYGFTFKRTSNAALSWADLTKQLSNESYCKKRPFAFSWGWIGGGGHMMVAKGYVTLAGVNYVVILDPWAPCVGDERIITYADFVASAGNWSHWDDFYDVTYTEGK